MGVHIGPVADVDDFVCVFPCKSAQLNYHCVLEFSLVCVSLLAVHAKSELEGWVSVKPGAVKGVAGLVGEAARVIGEGLFFL